MYKSLSHNTDRKHQSRGGAASGPVPAVPVDLAGTCGFSFAVLHSFVFKAEHRCCCFLYQASHPRLTVCAKRRRVGASRPSEETEQVEVVGEHPNQLFVFLCLLCYFSERDSLTTLSGCGFLSGYNLRVLFDCLWLCLFMFICCLLLCCCLNMVYYV